MLRLMLVALFLPATSAYFPLGLEYDEFQFAQTSDDYAMGSVWPKPQMQTPDPSEVVYSLLPSEFKFSSVGKTSDVLQAAIERYENLTFPDDTASKAKLKQITGLEINVKDAEEPLHLGTDESYILEVLAPSSSLTANTVWGAVRGLETFSQVVYQDHNGQYLANGSVIKDHPRFQHRGFMIDTARHFVDVNVILRFLDAMSYSKFNVLHWHIVDDQSFPFVSSTFPELSGQGARGGYNITHVYSKENIMNILEYARLRGIRVVPEFDTPGHTKSWGSISNLLTPCYNSAGQPDGTFGPINPTLESSYDFLQKFFGEVAERFPDTYVHLGGDEVRFKCWQSNPNITSWMNKMGFGQNYSLLEQYYEQRLTKIVSELKKSYIVWQEVFDNHVNIPKDTVINVWKPGWHNQLLSITKSGYKAILSSCWYLNRIHFGNDWHSHYQCDPTDFSGTEEQKQLVIGGTGCMWAEWVDGTNLLSRTWPRALAVGERLWSSANVTDLKDADARLWEHRCRYVRRGIPAEPGLARRFCAFEWPGYRFPG